MSAISVLDFKDPRTLANFLLDLSRNETEYDKYLSHKLVDNYEIANRRLKETLEQKQNWIQNGFANYVDEFECLVCEDAHKANKQEIRIVDRKHYDCPLPKNPLTRETDHDNWWTRTWLLEKCGAKLLAHRLKNNLTIDREKFESDKIKLYDEKKC